MVCVVVRDLTSYLDVCRTPHFGGVQGTNSSTDLSPNGSQVLTKQLCACNSATLRIQNSGKITVNDTHKGGTQRELYCECTKIK